MRCEVIAIGSELLLGQIVDTNSSWMGEQLALAGIDSHFQTKVGDNLERMVSVLCIALERSDAVILCGGLGPTADDITRDAIATVMGVELVRDPQVIHTLETRFKKLGREMPRSNLRQADRPVGSKLIEQTPGTVPGLICPFNNKVIYAVPGVPFEMRIMLTGTVLPDLRQRAKVTSVIKSRTLKTWGTSEARLGELLTPRLEALDQSQAATIAFLASGIEGLKVRITAKAATDTEVEEILEQEAQAVHEILGHLVFGVDEDTMESVILRMLGDRNLSLAVAEPLTGGLLSYRLTSTPGYDSTFRGGVNLPFGISFEKSAYEILGIPRDSALSPALAEIIAQRVARLWDTDVGLAVVGVPGPNEQFGYPSGQVFYGLVCQGKVERGEARLPGDSRRIREYAVIGLLDFLRQQLLSQ